MLFRVAYEFEAGNEQDVRDRLASARSLEIYALREPCLEPVEVYNQLKYLAIRKREHFVALALDSRSRIIKKKTISIGTVNASLIHPRELFRFAVKACASSLIVTHNHPSGDTEPSTDDLDVTKRLVEASKLMGIHVNDHIIIGQGYLSFRERGLL